MSESANEDRQQPDLVAIVRRDGALLDFFGGIDLPQLRPNKGSKGASVERVWAAPMATALLQSTRKAIAVRSVSETHFELNGRRYEVRATARGPDRASCHIRAAIDTTSQMTLDTRRVSSKFERRGFMRRYREAIALASLTDKPAAVAVIQLDSAQDLTQSLDLDFTEKAVSLAIDRLDTIELPDELNSGWFMGQLGPSLLVVVFESSSRSIVEGWLSQVCASLHAPLACGGLDVHLNPFAGAAILGRDASSPKALLDCARAAASEARRMQLTNAQFFSDTMRMRSLTRIDMARELRDAITDGSIRLRYTGRYNLRSGELKACVAYLRWTHPLRGEVPPGEFLRLAETTGLAESLSRAALNNLRQDYAQLAPQLPTDTRFSFGGLKNHVLSADFVRDIEQLLDSGAIPANKLELRVAERTCLIREPEIFRPLVERGVQVLVDEVGRDAGALRKLASAPLWGLQLDRAWATNLQSDPTALKLCRAVVALAKALDLTPIAAAVDNHAQLETLLALGCELGQGDIFAPIAIAPESSAAPSHLTAHYSKQVTKSR